ncbi:MAG TPA: hypothetical protein VJC16_02680 [Candidatus Nanoarchaeia archaeon]|nr:hypothetical protein [Candidatus Nanoarchaeia archaeon]
MGLVSGMQEYVQEQNQHAARRGLPQDISVTGLHHRCTDQMQPDLYQGKDLLVISHPGFHRLVSGYDRLAEHLLWEKYGIGRKRTGRRMAELHKLQYASRGAGMALKSELALEDLAARAALQKMPTILTVPGMRVYPPVDEIKIFSGLRDAVRSGDIAQYTALLESRVQLEDNEAGSYRRFVRRLLRKVPDAYLLPTECSDGEYTGAVMGDHWHHVSLRSRAMEEVQRQIVPVVVQGKVRLRLSKEQDCSPLFQVTAPLESLFTYPLDHPTNRDFVAAFGEGCVQELAAAYARAMADLRRTSKDHIAQDPTVTRLLYPLLATEWKTIYFAGSNLQGCVQGTAEYLVEFRKDPRLAFLYPYLTPNGKVPELPPRQQGILARQAPLLLDSAGAPAARRALRQALSELGKEEILREGKEVKRHLALLNKLVHLESGQLLLQ